LLGAAAALLFILAAGCEPPKPWAQLPQDRYVTSPSGLSHAVLKEGSGAPVKQGQTAHIHYTGWIKWSGEEFDSSLKRNEPLAFELGKGGVIRGWDEGVAGMKTGEKRQLVIPADLAYGAAGSPDGNIPPNSALVFEVELVKVQ
jgi:peptidylprolyl isomerase